LIDRDYHNNFRIIKFVSILGAVSFSVLSGKIMFRDVHIITEDFTMRIQYGQQFNLTSPKNISGKFGVSHHCKNLIFESFSEFQLKMVSP
jgi:hypothetical protein